MVKTPDRRKKACVCHVNMLKRYVERDQADVLTESAAWRVSLVVSVASPSFSSGGDELGETPVAVPCPHLENLKILCHLNEHLSCLSEPMKQDVCELIRVHAALFTDKPTQTTVLQHDVDLGGHKLIKQHAYRVNPTRHAAMLNEVEYPLVNNLAVPSSSAWSSLCLLVPKSDKTLLSLHGIS